MDMKRRFSDSDLDRIKVAVKAAENQISGEIVPVIVEHSGRYLIANYKGSLIGSALSFLIMIVLDRYVIVDATSTLFMTRFSFFLL